MRFAQRVEVPTGAHAIARTAISLVMNMKTMICIRLKPTETHLHANFFTRLRKNNGAARGIALGRLKFCHGRRARRTYMRAARNDKGNGNAKNSLIQERLLK
jgi:hypothetical protein